MVPLGGASQATRMRSTARPPSAQPIDVDGLGTMRGDQGPARSAPAVRQGAGGRVTLDLYPWWMRGDGSTFR